MLKEKIFKMPKMSREFWEKVIIFSSIFALGAMIAQPVVTTAASSQFADDFSQTYTLAESSTITGSTNVNWWLTSGGRVNDSLGRLKSIQGDLSFTDPARIAYAKSNSTDTDGGLHPQNLLRILTKTRWQNYNQQVYTKIDKINLSSSPNRAGSNGISLMNRDQDSNDLYYVTLRVDGKLVVKKKLNGVYNTLGQTTIYAGTYNRDTNPSLIPVNKWIGLRDQVVNNTDGSVSIKVFTDQGWTGTWKQVLEVKDSSSVISSQGYAGMRTDFMDVTFDNYKISNLDWGSVAPPVNPPVTPPITPPTTGTDVTFGNSLVGNWKLNGNALSTLGRDNGKVVGSGVTWVPGKFGQAAHFDGKSYIEIPDEDYFSPSTFGQHLTVSFWVKPDDYNFAGENSEGYIHFLGKQEWNSAPNYEWVFRLYNHTAFDEFPRPERLSFYVFNKGGGLGAASELNYAAPAAQWTHIVGEIDGANTKFYVNGKMVDMDPVAEYNINMSNGNAPVRIGTADMDSFYKGAISNVMIYNRALTDSEVQQLYQADLSK